MKNPLILIAEERQNQINQGFTPAQDDTHTDGEIAEAASCYAAFANINVTKDGFYAVCDRTYRWPWKPEDFKPDFRDRIGELVKAGALIVAEIERLQRKEAKPYVCYIEELSYKPIGFKEELSNLINKHSLENNSDTSDYLLAQYLDNCLINYEETVTMRDNWHSKDKQPGEPPVLFPDEGMLGCNCRKTQPLGKIS
jgi:hypothetical protein